LIDKFDKLRLLTDPESKMVENGVLAAGRRMDKHILNAFFADAKTGVSGASTTTFTAANEVDVAVGGAVAELKTPRQAVPELQVMVLPRPADRVETEVRMEVTRARFREVAWVADATLRALSAETLPKAPVVVTEAKHS
jgi:hypothetical protein